MCIAWFAVFFWKHFNVPEPKRNRKGFTHQDQLNIRSFHARWKAHYSPLR